MALGHIAAFLSLSPPIGNIGGSLALLEVSLLSRSLSEDPQRRHSSEPETQWDTAGLHSTVVVKNAPASDVALRPLSSRATSIPEHLRTDSVPMMKTVPIPRQSLSSAVAERLREKIVRGELQDGEQLRQDRLAFEFEVSRIPVREALRQLEAEGLIKIVAHRGAVVSALSPDEIEELFDIRALLECEVLRLSIPRLTDADLEKAGQLCAAFDKSVQQDDDSRHWDRLNAQFHAVLYSRADRPQFTTLIRMVVNNGERYSRLQAYLKRGFELASAEHRMLLELCRKKDVAAACTLLHSHISRAGRSLKEFVTIQRERTRENAERARESGAHATAE